MTITDSERRTLQSLIESYGDRALRAVGLAHRDIPGSEIPSNTEALSPEQLEHDLVLDAIVVRVSTFISPRLIRTNVPSITAYLIF